MKYYDRYIVTYELIGYMEVVLPARLSEYSANRLPLLISHLSTNKEIFSDDNVCYINSLD